MAMCAATSSRLSQHCILAPNAGLRVSPLQLGSASVEDNGNGGMDSTIARDTAFALLDAFFEAGGNFIDTSNWLRYTGMLFLNKN
ncbi:hypothetical protein J3R82DRAFT_3551 [Butyriboletus roseoflavus]|nr:hypothetical protein J3R82DRAFT_3551 [Butyriboletus roseoflavus]